MASPAFNHWLSHRIKQSPRPSDPYRAYMIDLSLHAGKPKKVEQWQKEPNRLDISGIDTPMFATGNEFPIFSPAPKPKGRREGRKPQKKGVTYAIPTPKATHEREIVQLIQGAAMKYNTAPPQIEVGTAKADSPRAQNFFAPAINPFTGRINGGLINVQGGGSRASAIAVAAHETGHYVHANASPEDLRKQGHNVRYRVKADRRGGSAETFAIEATASRIGKSLPAFKRLPVQDQIKGKWAMRTWLETYRRDAYYERDPANPAITHLKFSATSKFKAGEEKKWGA